MLVLTLPDMTCGGCLRSASAAIATIDPAARVTGDLPRQQVTIESDASPERLRAALAAAGFPAAG